MDSSRQKALYLPETWTPWHARRLALRLERYKTAKRCSWRQIADDITVVEGLPQSFFEREDPKLFAESLRCLAAGTRIPTEDRLSAASIFLFEEGYLGAEDLQMNDAGASAAIAFAEFATSDTGSVQGRRESMAGKFVWTEHQENRFFVSEVLIDPDGEMDRVLITKSQYDDPSKALNLEAIRRGAPFRLISEIKLDGWAALLSGRQIVLFAKERVFADEPFCGTVVAAEAGVSRDEAISELMIQSLLAFHFYDRSDTARPANSDPEASWIDEFIAGQLGKNLKRYSRSPD